MVKAKIYSSSIALTIILCVFPSNAIAKLSTGSIQACIAFSTGKYCIRIRTRRGICSQI